MPCVWIVYYRIKCSLRHLPPIFIFNISVIVYVLIYNIVYLNTPVIYTYLIERYFQHTKMLYAGTSSLHL